MMELIVGFNLLTLCNDHKQDHMLFMYKNVSLLHSGVYRDLNAMCNTEIVFKIHVCVCIEQLYMMYSENKIIN